jgi:hypothetical protein
MRPSPLAKPICRCIKKVRNTVKLRTIKQVKQNIKKEKEKAAIAICIKSVLQTRGKTLKRFKCGKKPYLLTQPFK